MTASRDPDRLVQTFFQEGPEELSARSMSAIRDGIHGTKQRAARRPWRDLPMPRALIIIAPIAALLLVGAALLLGSGGGPTPVVSPTASAVATSAVVSPSALASPSPSPTGYPLADGEAWILFMDTTESLKLIRPDGTGRHTMLSHPAWEMRDATWSPDGQQVVYMLNDGRGAQLWVADHDGTGDRALTSGGDGCPTGLCNEAVQPAWSPDGRTIAYIAPQNNAGLLVKYSLMLLDVASGVSTERYATTDTTLARPTWSPDSRRIAFEVATYQGSVEISAVKDTAIAVLDAAGEESQPTVITDGTRLAGFPSWHPTDDRIVFRTNLRTDAGLVDPALASNLYTMRSDGSELTALTDNAVGGPIMRAPTWTPDGRILFSVIAEATAGDEVMRLIGADGTGETSATGSVITLGEGRWRPTP